MCDDDVIWEADYEDFIYINKDGQRVLDHSRIDKLKSVKVMQSGTSFYLFKFIFEG